VLIGVPVPEERTTHHLGENVVKSFVVFLCFLLLDQLLSMRSQEQIVGRNYKQGKCNCVQLVAGNLTLGFYVNWEMNCEFTRIGL